MVDILQKSMNSKNNINFKIYFRGGRETISIMIMFMAPISNLINIKKH